jgi:spermidine synthase
VEPQDIRRVGIVGLGTGELGCYAKPGQQWTFYEIDPLVERIARDRDFFQFMSRCGNEPTVVLGDARLTLERAGDGSYDVLVIDAFSSDSIPTHLLTEEALALYLKKLSARGVVLFHISNRYLDLAPVVAALAFDAGVQARFLSYQPEAGTPLWRSAGAKSSPWHHLWQPRFPHFRRWLDCSLQTAGIRALDRSTLRYPS